MIAGLYAIKDDLGEFKFYSPFVNDAIAIRSFKIACNADPDLPVADVSLYKIGNFDTVTGNICEVKLDFLMRGEKE